MLFADLEPHFGLGLSPSDFNSDRIVPRMGDFNFLTGYRRPWAIARKAVHDMAENKKNLHIGRDGFLACVDVHHFQPSEISVKTVDNTVVVECQHEERDYGNGTTQRHFVRKYILPDDFDMSAVHSALTSDGVLTLKAPPPHAAAKGERYVPITHTNAPAHLSVKDNKPVDLQNGHE